MEQLLVLFEHSTGLALFRVGECEEMSFVQASVRESVNDVAKFRSRVKLEAFNPFHDLQEALDCAHQIAVGSLPKKLMLFLTQALKKRQNFVLGCYKDVAEIVHTELKMKVQFGDGILEILRGIRLHFKGLIKSLESVQESTAQAGLAHVYSRSQVKFNPHRSDNFIIQSINYLDTLDKAVNTFSMRVREWFSYHFPELSKHVKETGQFIRAVDILESRNNTSDEITSRLAEILGDTEKAERIVHESKTSMGYDIADQDVVAIHKFTSRLLHLMRQREGVFAYLQKKLDLVSPNLHALVGPHVAARLISHAGSLTNLAKFPASTVQILGAEKALFRALKSRGNTPKYGIIFNSSFIGQASQVDKGKISRLLAAKCSIASRIDCFDEMPNKVYGTYMKKQIEDRLKYFRTGEEPKQNYEVMAEAYFAAEKKKRKMKRKLEKEKLTQAGVEEVGNEDEKVKEENTEDTPPKKKRKKAYLSSTVDVECSGAKKNEETSVVEKKKKKRKKQSTKDVLDTNEYVKIEKIK